MSKRMKLYQSADIVEAVLAGNIVKLQELVNASTLPMVEIGQQTTGCGKTILHHAVESRNLPMVQYVIENFQPNPDAEEENRLTPLNVACTQRCPVEIITYLFEHKGTMGPERGTPLEFAVRHNWHELARALIELEAKLGLEPSERPLRIVIAETGDAEMLQLLLDAPHGKVVRIISCDIYETTALTWLAERDSYELEKKIACLKILIKMAHPEAYTSDPERYNVDDILVLAFDSDISLCSYIIETERKWEKRALVQSLYERLIPEYRFLALLVLCECGPVSGDRDDLALTLTNLDRVTWPSIGSHLQLLFQNAINLCDEDCANDQGAEALQLLEDFATFCKSITLSRITDILEEAVTNRLLHTTYSTEHLYRPSFHRANEVMVKLLGDTTDGILLYVFRTNFFHVCGLIMVFSMLRHCASLAIPLEYFTNLRIYHDEIFRWNWIMHLFGPWKEIQQHVGKPKLELFTLKRFARDVVRESVWHGVKGRTASEQLFLDHLQSLNLPRELNEYLRFCDHSCTEYFAKHYGVEMITESLNR